MSRRLREFLIFMAGVLSMGGFATAANGNYWMAASDAAIVLSIMFVLHRVEVES